MTSIKALQALKINPSFLGKAAGDVINYQTLFLLFMLGSVAGFLVEGVCHIFKAGCWENHSAVVWGPFCIIYGIGAIAVYTLSCCLLTRGWFQKFIVFTLSGAVIEYVASLLQETLLGSVSWDYSDHFMNIGGRVSLQMALFWGVLGLLFVKILFPVVNRLLCRMRGKSLALACKVLSVFMVINLIVTVAALFRWQQRQNDVAASCAIEVVLDRYFNDEVMTRLYPNMIFQ